MKQSVHAPLLSLLLSVVLTLDNAYHVSAFNFDTLDTPLLDAFTDYFCQNQDGPLCSFLTGDDESEEGLATVTATAESPTVGDFLVRTGCDLGFFPRDFCRSVGESDEQEKGKDKDQTIAGTTEDQSLVDGQMLALLCGEDGYGPKEVCEALVGKEGTSGLIRSFCETGTVLPPGVCEMVGISDSRAGDAMATAEGDNNGGRNLRH